VTFSRASAKLMAILIAGGLMLLSATPSSAQFPFRKKKKINKSTSADNTAEPDKILYDKAMADIKHGRHEVGRLNLQTLINTYPDSEYLAKAKLAIADSYYKEGGTANTTQAIQAYQDFDVFFPMLPEAAYAQLQVAMAHFRQMEKPDRDRTQAREAEDAFQTFLHKYPNDPLADKAAQYLREVQEVLAEGDFRIGYFYYTTRGDKRAAASRLAAVVNRYPLYSKADRALWMLGNIWEGTEKKELAAPYYARIVREYPLSPLVPQAKNKLVALKAPVPQPDPKAVAWMTALNDSPRKHDSFVKKPLSLVNTKPRQELLSAATVGAPTMTPESESNAGVDILSGGNQSRIAGAGTGIVATVTPASTAGTTAGAENVTAPAEGGEAKPEAQKPDSAASAAAGDAASGSTAPITSDPPPKTDGTGDATGTRDGTAKPDGTAGASGQASTGTKADAAETREAGPQAGSSTDNKDNKKKESSSKKKKGLKKIIPW
ncbi:MAG TPA: outer membrane protein assembly factor BamD, partial [Candidatus Dormibacteraeota bacterium]|nr:outer membrane protein assembly factor BamD [Candidatus Dormibacteraeota bacterium]